MSNVLLRGHANLHSAGKSCQNKHSSRVSLAGSSPRLPYIPSQLRRPQSLVKAEQSDEDFDASIKRLREAKGKTAYGESRKDSVKQGKNEQKPKYDFSGEKVHFEGPPHRGDLATNIALGTTLLWLPLTFAAIGRAAFVKYRFTDKRLSVITQAPWKQEQLDAAYQEVKDVATVGRGVGIWGDMVVTLRNNDKIELRSLPDFLELKKYILERRDALNGENVKSGSGGAKSSKKGFSA